MNAAFFALAFSAALNPKLLALDLLLIENRRPRAMFLCVLLGGMTMALTIGLLDVARAPEYWSRCVTIADCGRRAGSAYLLAAHRHARLPRSLPARWGVRWCVDWPDCAARRGARRRRRERGEYDGTPAGAAAAS